MMENEQGRAVAGFLESLRSSGIAERTITQYESNLRRFSRWLAEQGDPGTRGDRGVSEPQKATQLDVAVFKRSAVTHWKPSTVRQTLIHLSKFFDYCVAKGLIPDNPAKYVEQPTVEVSAPKWLTRNEQNALIRAARQHGDLRELTILTVLLHTGLRVQELCDLKVSDVQIGDRKGKITVRAGKYGKRREIPLNLDARRSLVAWLAENGQGKPEGYVFRTQRTDQMTTRAVQHIFGKYQKLTGIDGLTAHALRHTFGHELMCRRVPMDVVARLMGHAKADGTPNLQMTARYTLPDENDLQRAVEELSWT